MVVCGDGAYIGGVLVMVVVWMWGSVVLVSGVGVVVVICSGVVMVVLLRWVWCW